MSKYDSLKINQFVAMRFLFETHDLYFVGKNSKGEYQFTSTRYLTDATPFCFTEEEIDRYLVHVFEEMPKKRSRFSLLNIFPGKPFTHPIKEPKSVKRFRETGVLC